MPALQDFRRHLPQISKHDYLSFALVFVAAGLAYCAVKLRPEEDRTLLTPCPELFDFGRVRRGELDGEFRLTNTSNRHLEIAYVIPGCSCESVEVPRARVGPGESVIGKFRWSAFAELGITEKHFLVAFRQESENETRFTKCTFRGDVFADFEFEPKEFRFSLTDVDLQTAIIKFTSSIFKDFAVTSSECVHPAFSVECERAKNEVVVIFDPSKWSKHDIEFGHKVSISTNCKHGGECVVPVVFSR